MTRDISIRWAILFLAGILPTAFSPPANAQWAGLKVSGQKIVDERGNNVILRGFGIGELANIEAYMVKFPDGDHAQALWFYGSSRIHDMITSLCGPEVEQSFVSTWESNIVNDADFAAMQGWGVNSIRVSINYHWLSPKDGVYLQSGWDKIDRLVGFAKNHNIRLILCLHAAPGGQSPELMCDSADGIAHLWTDPAVYQTWTTHLWQAIAARYVNEPAIAGYDLMDEPILDEKNPMSGVAAVRDYYVALSAAIRKADTHHIIFAEGMDWAGSAEGPQGLMPPWDGNLCLVVHDYEQSAAKPISGFASLRTQYNIPVWDGESGEKSNQWAKSLVGSLEPNNIGWIWWTYKKVDGKTQPYSIKAPAGWPAIVTYAQSFETGTKPSASAATAAFNELAANAATSQCSYNGELITSLFGVSPPIFSLSGSSTSLAVSADSAVSFTAKIAPIRGFKGDVTLDAKGLPASATASFSSATITGGAGSSTVTITAASTTPAGSYPLIIAGATDGLTEQAFVTLTVKAAGAN